MSRRSRNLVLVLLFGAFVFFIASYQRDTLLGAAGDRRAPSPPPPQRHIKAEQQKPIVVVEDPAAKHEPHQDPPPAPPPPPPPKVEEKPSGPADSYRKSAFDSIYDNNVWGSDESRSGPGSTVKNTVRIRNLLDTVFAHFKIKHFLDAPCGDCNWQPHLKTFKDISYTGADIVNTVITHNMRKYLDRPNMRFVNLDLVLDKIPQGQFEAILSRDAVQHLPLADGTTLYQNFEQSGAKYLISNFHDPSFGKYKNKDIGAGAFYDNHPFLPPFNLSLPLFYTIDASDEHLIEAPYERKYVAVWKLPALHLGDGKAFEPDEELAKQGLVPVTEEGRKVLEELGLKIPSKAPAV
ncbi:hypothetical protein DFS34DRAFT_644405 [Phlyctochytrium arcticum]|nr:hypothetical protein DFS34DRAFT_644405 [Phlyctochytrium arcticum]